MKLEKLLSEAVSLNEAIETIQANNSHSFIWIPVKNKKGSHFEIGGRNKDNKFEFKVYIIPFKDGEYRTYSNGFTQSEYALTNDGEFITSSSNGTIKNFDSVNFIKFLDKTDFREYKPNIKTYYQVTEIFERSDIIKL